MMMPLPLLLLLLVLLIGLVLCAALYYYYPRDAPSSPAKPSSSPSAPPPPRCTNCRRRHRRQEEDDAQALFLQFIGATDPAAPPRCPDSPACPAPPATATPPPSPPSSPPCSPRGAAPGFQPKPNPTSFARAQPRPSFPGLHPLRLVAAADLAARPRPRRMDLTAFMPPLVAQTGGGTCRIFAVIYYIGNYMHAARSLGFYDSQRNALRITALNYASLPHKRFAAFYARPRNLVNPMFNFFMAAPANRHKTQPCKAYFALPDADADRTCEFLFDAYYNALFGYGCLSMHDFPYFSESDLAAAAAASKPKAKPKAKPKVKAKTKTKVQIPRYLMHNPCAFAHRMRHSRIDPFIVGTFRTLYLRPTHDHPDGRSCRLRTSVNPQTFTHTLGGEQQQQQQPFARESYLDALQSFLDSGIPLQWGVRRRSGLGLSFSLGGDGDGDGDGDGSGGGGGDGGGANDVLDLVVVGYRDADPDDDPDAGHVVAVAADRFEKVSYAAFFADATLYLFAFM